MSINLTISPRQFTCINCHGGFQSTSRNALYCKRTECQRVKHELEKRKKREARA